MSKYITIRQIIFYILLIIPSIITLKHLGGYSTEIPSNVITWSLMIIFMCVSLINVILKQEFFWSQNTVTFFIFVLIISSTFLINHGFRLNGSEILLGTTFSFLFFSLLQQQRIEPKRFFGILIGISILHAIIGFSQMFGIDQIKSIVNLKHSKEFSQSYGVTSLFLQPNLYATFLSVGIGSLMIGFHEKWIKNKWFYSIYILISTALMISSSRSGILSYLILVSLFIFFNKSNKSLIFVFSISTLISIVLGLSIVESTAKFEDKVYLGDPVRLDLYRLSLKIFMNNFWTGIGYIDFMRQFFFLTRDIGTNNPYLINWTFAHPHNELLYWILMGGVINLIGIFILLIKFAFNNKKQFGYKYLVIIPILVNLSFEQPFINNIYFLVLFLIFIANSESQLKTYDLQLNGIVKKFSIFCLTITTLITSVISIHGVYSIQSTVNLHQEKNIEQIFNNKTFIGTPLIGKKLYENTLNTLIFNAAINTKNIELINYSIDYWEKRAEYIPAQTFLTKLYYLYLLKKDEQKLNELEVKLKYYYDKRFEIINKNE